MYNYFCNWCGHRFGHHLPERDAHGILNAIPCPVCGSWDVYLDSDDGYQQAKRAQNEFEAKMLVWED